MKILVTGGAGFIGSHVVRKLMNDGDEPVAVDNLSSGLRENLSEEARLIVMDVLDESIMELFQKERFDAVVHLAGQTMVDTSLHKPDYDARENIIGGIRIMEACRQTNVKRIIFSSSAAVYGDVAEDDLPVRESQSPAPMSFYGLSKLTIEHYMELYHRIYGLDYVVLRFSNVFGERQGDGGEGGVISIFAKQVAKGKPITIFGDGEQTRDFIYAGDVASGVAAALHTESVNTVYNLSSKSEISIRQLVTYLSAVTGKKIVPKYGPPRPGDIYRSCLDNQRASRGLNWTPETPLEDALKQTYEYLLKR